MRAAQIVHGDLQHDNVLLVPRKALAKFRLRLIDYDGLIVPALANRPTGELGHRNYQHPQRLREGGFNAEADRFPHLVIYTAFRCLVSGGRPLWDRYDSGDNLLFREKDFQEPASSALFKELLASRDSTVCALASYLLLASQGPLNRVPLIQELPPSGAVPPLAPAQRDRVQAVMGGTAAAIPPAPAVTVTLVQEEDTAAPSLSEKPASTPAGSAVKAVATAPLTTGSAVVRGTAGVVRKLVAWGRDRPEWSTRSLGAAAAVCLTVVLLAMIAGVVARSLRTPAGQPPLPPPPTVPAPMVELPLLAPMEDITLNVGENMVKVGIDRHGYEGPVEIAMNGLPEGVTLKVVALGPKDHAILVFQAALRAAEKEMPVEIVLYAGTALAHKQTVLLRVQRPSVSSVTISPTSMLLLAGEKEGINVFVRRQGYLGPIDVLLLDLPQGLMCDPVTIPAGESTSVLQLRTHPNTDKWIGRVTGAARVGNYEVGQWKIAIEVHRPPAGMRLVAIPAIAVKIGQTQSVKVTVDRRGYRGPVEVRIDRLPPGVTCAPAVLMGSDGLATLELIADKRATEGERTVEVNLAVGMQLFDQQKVTLKVEKAPRATPPEENIEGKKP
jgi:hypothetical protein